VAREHNEHNVGSGSPVPEHFSNEPLFDSRDEAAAEGLDILNESSTARSPARGHPGHQGVQESNRADVGALILLRWRRKALLNNVARPHGFNASTFVSPELCLTENCSWAPRGIGDVICTTRRRFEDRNGPKRFLASQL
jgi:hypothetical protein